MLLEFTLLPVSLAPAEALRQATEIVIVANAAKVRIFPGDRLEPHTIEKEYQDYTLVLGRLGHEPVATMTCIVKDHGLKVELLAILPEHHGKGLAAQMLTKADEIARESGQKIVWLEAADLGGLVAHYQKLGFVEEKRTHLPIGYWGAIEEFDLVALSRKVD